MAVPLETVVKQLTDSGIIAPGKLEDFIPPKAHPKSVEELVEKLVKHNHLTKFQAQNAKAGKARALILGNYTILDKIGAGGMGQVFKAKHRRMDRIVAIKMLPAAMLRDAEAVARFEREVQAAARLRHTNIVAADDADEANGVHFLVMEYIEGSDLSALVRKNGPLSISEAVNYILQAARGLEYAHKNGVIHRDIKPANLLLNSEGTLKVLDMGLARIESDGNAATQAQLTGTGAVMGTVDYMAPEQALKTKTADARADIYSLGCSLYYLLSGKATYDGDSIMEKLLAHREQPIPSLRDVQADVPKQVETIFRKMVAKKVKDRYQTMTEVVAALEALGLGGASGTGEAAKAWTLSAEERKRLAAKAPTKSPASLVKAVVTHKTTYLVAKIVGGLFATIIAPILVLYIQKYLEKDDTPPKPAAVAAAATKTGGALDPRPITNVNSPDFEQWMKDVAALPAEKQVEAVSKKLVELNPGFDGKLTGHDLSTPVIENGLVKEVAFNTDKVTDISPLRAFVGLKSLDCNGDDMGIARKTKFSDLSPLKGMQLTTLNCCNTQVSDLSPLQGMPLVFLYFGNTQVSHLTALEGMTTLAVVNCSGTSVADLSPLQDCKSLRKVQISKSKVTAATVAALQRARPNCKIEWDGPENVAAAQANKPWTTPAFQAWLKQVAAMPAERQIQAVSRKLMELNPGFDGKVNDSLERGPPRIENGVVTDFAFFTDNVTDISPVRALVGLRTLNCNGSDKGRGTLSDLSPLKGMTLHYLSCGVTQVSDLSPLQGMPLTKLYCNATQVSDLSPLQGMSLKKLSCSYTKVFDLSPLKGMPMKALECHGTQVSDLSPLRGMTFTELHCYDTPVSDLSPLQGLNLTEIRLTPKSITKGIDSIRQMKSLKVISIGGGEQDKFPTDEFWRRYDAGEFGKPAPTKPIATFDNPAFQQWMKTVAVLPADEQWKVVVKKLQELNPGFDGKVTGFDGRPTPTIKNGVVTELKLITYDVADISPVRALTGLKGFYCVGSGGGTGKLSDLSPLQGLPLTDLFFGNTQVSDLSPLRGMPLMYLDCSGTPMSDLSPLEGCKSLGTLHIKHTQVTAAGVAALQKALPNCKIEWDGPNKP